MKLGRLLTASTLVVAAWMSTAGTSNAAVVYDGIALFSGEQSFTQSFNISAPGTLTFSLSAIPWLDTVSNLSGFLSSSTGQLGGTLTGAGTETVDVGAGTFYAHWFGDASGTYNLGVVGLKIDFQPGSVTPVGLPTSLVLMLSGLGLLFGWQGRRAPNFATA